MRIAIVTPAAHAARTGNRHTAVRWARMLRAAGHAVRVSQAWDGRSADVMIALHARRSHESIARYAGAFPDRPLVVVLTGTDVYRDIHTHLEARASLTLATRLVALQPAAVRELAPGLRGRTRVIYQSAPAMRARARRRECFEIVVSGHLRDEKDPFRAALALAHVPQDSRIRVTHLGGAIAPGMDETARALMMREPRYEWVGELAHAAALRVLARAALLVVSSRMEGGANVICEALAAGVPVIASRISGNIGLLGPRYPGYYAPADSAALAALMLRAENDAAYYARLQRACAARAHVVTPERERAALAALLAELAPQGHTAPPARVAGAGQGRR